MVYAPRFFLSMAIALLAFAAVTYSATGSLATTAIQTLACAVLIQVGYFLAVLYLVWREARTRRSEIDLQMPVKHDAEMPQPKVPASMNEPGHSKF
jgi:exopolysaccharide production repressor protein